MRVKVSLSADEPFKISFNHQYYLASAIYNIVKEGNPNFAEKLHKIRDFKFYTFSTLKLPRRVIYKDYLESYDGKAYFYVSSPNKEFIECFVNGLFEKGRIRVGNIIFHIERISLLESPKEFKILKTLSPIYLKTKVEEDGRLKTKDLLPTHSKFYENLKKNLKRKYEKYFNKECNLDFDFEILKFKPKRVKIKGGYLTCSDLVFKVWGDYELIKFGYDCGFGEKNSLGFGMVEVSK
ncbi:CRISPR-associated protein Cas6 [Methanocaldococcus infernus ME]|uniref:CRISPR-associated protein Cas6 n=1 Tax=Methanocaldococcus infernus (strain DSM 11812 / JCM 15783 / ME) TaxID=573063 RepID=D5VTJ3_METIM|nr:CRISPR-associated endoribonuclease Cas6 [Methanocaldococcus infernus]ADG13896.1 CRISPR-associated protein Cas6 [Methanocaldococcus infernus ME]